MLDKHGFDEWSKDYDAAVKQSDASQLYPFAGYQKVLKFLRDCVFSKGKPTVLDIGFGTAALTQQLYEGGCKIYGLDFSSKMLALAQSKMPEATLLQADFTNGLPKILCEQRYDIILSSYAIHHLSELKQEPFLLELLSLLNAQGIVLLGDIMFENQTQLEVCKNKAKEAWDEEENYIVIEAFPEIQNIKKSFYPMSYCAGVLVLEKTA